MIDIPKDEPVIETSENIAVIAKSEATEAINPLCSCVSTAKQVFPEIPLIDAIDYPLNGTQENGEIVIIKYPNTYHIAPYKVGTSTLKLYNEGNFEPCQKTEREIPIDDPKIVGYFDYDLWLEIDKLSPQLKAILKDESHFNHYLPDGSVIKGKANEFGLAQLQRRTWNWFNELRSKQELPKLYDIFDPFEQIKMLEWAEQNNLLDHWSCVKEKRCLATSP